MSEAYALDLESQQSRVEKALATIETLLTKARDHFARLKDEANLYDDNPGLYRQLIRGAVTKIKELEDRSLKLAAQLRNIIRQRRGLAPRPA